MLFILATLAPPALSNGVAALPPLGWCSWQRYRCAIACNDSTSDECLNERLIKSVADALVAGGYKDAGYQYVALDDCWQAPHRVNGRVVADPQRFPSGIKALADYVHARGLKLGLYTAMGSQTCAMGRVPYSSGLGLGCNYEQIDQGCRPACSCADERPCACTCEIFADPDSQPQRREVAAGPRRRRGGEEGEHPDKYETYPEQRRRVLRGHGCSARRTHVSRGCLADLSNIRSLY